VERIIGGTVTYGTGNCRLLSVKTAWWAPRGRNMGGKKNRKEQKRPWGSRDDISKGNRALHTTWSTSLRYDKPSRGKKPPGTGMRSLAPEYYHQDSGGGKKPPSTRAKYTSVAVTGQKSVKKEKEGRTRAMQLRNCPLGGGTPDSGQPTAHRVSQEESNH